MAVQHARVTVATTATLLTAPGADNIVGTSIAIRNRGTAAVFLGDATVTTATGYELSVGDTISLDLGDGETVHGIAAADQRVDVLRAGV